MADKQVDPNSPLNQLLRGVASFSPGEAASSYKNWYNGTAGALEQHGGFSGVLGTDDMSSRVSRTGYGGTPPPKLVVPPPLVSQTSAVPGGTGLKPNMDAKGNLSYFDKNGAGYLQTAGGDEGTGYAVVEPGAKGLTGQAWLDAQKADTPTSAVPPGISNRQSRAATPWDISQTDPNHPVDPNNIGMGSIARDKYGSPLGGNVNILGSYTDNSPVPKASGFDYNSPEFLSMTPAQQEMALAANLARSQTFSEHAANLAAINAIRKQQEYSQGSAMKMAELQNARDLEDVKAKTQLAANEATNNRWFGVQALRSEGLGGKLDAGLVEQMSKEIGARIRSGMTPAVARESVYTEYKDAGHLPKGYGGGQQTAPTPAPPKSSVVHSDGSTWTFTGEVDPSTRNPVYTDGKGHKATDNTQVAQ